MAQLDRVLSVNEIDRTVTVEAGISLVAIEKELALRNFTLGHFPQSFHGATVGGSLMANGAGQVSDLYGRMSDMLVSARLVTPQGMWATEPFRHAGAGPWLGSLVAGSEGLFGILADVTLKIRPQPQMIEDRAWYLPSFGAGCEVLRHLAQDGHGMAMLRLSDPAETEFYGRVRLMSKGLQRPGFLERSFLAFKNAPQNPALLMGAFEGQSASRNEAFRQVDAAVKKHGGVSLGTGPGKSWRKSRFDTPHLRESILAHDLAVDTFETATTWSGMEALHQDLLSSLERAGSDVLSGNRRAIAFSHVSHTYAEGASLYATMIFQRGDEPLAEWHAVKAAAAKAIHRAGATISHHHGLGFMHATDALNEKSEIGRRLLGAIRNQLDPQNILASGAENWIG
jgi:alkyldihydroxyacetonephosphate synthase